MQARFSKDYSKLCYFSSEKEFLSHTGNYQFKYIDWPSKSAPITVLDYFPEYPKDDELYCGLYGYNMTFTPCKFLGNSNRYYLIVSEFKG
jgi:hypothetical protein